MPQQENWAIKENPQTTRLPPVEKLCSCSRTSTACVCGIMHTCMLIRIPYHRMTSPCMWPPSVISDGCHSCFSFICRQWEPVIRLGWAASHAVLQERLDDFFSHCLWEGSGPRVRCWENVQQVTWPLWAGCQTLCYTAKHAIISILTEEKEAGQYQDCLITLCTSAQSDVHYISAFGEWGWGPSFCTSVWTLYWLKSIISS